MSIRVIIIFFSRKLNDNLLKFLPEGIFDFNLETACTVSKTFN